MSANEPNDSDSSALENLVGTALGVPLPTPIQRNLFKAIGALLASGTDIGVAWLQDKADAIRLRTQERRLVVMGAAQATAEEALDRTSALSRRAMAYNENRFLREQANREGTVRLLVAGLQTAAGEKAVSEAATATDVEEIDDDWLYMFADVAQRFSNEDMQALFARVLEGEVLKPGSFSADTLMRASTLSAKVATTFQKFCNIASHFGPYIGIMVGPYGSPGANGLIQFGLSYSDLGHLQTAGLVQSDLDTSISMDRSKMNSIASLPMSVGGQRCLLSPAQAMPEQLEMVFLTAPGSELSAALTASLDAMYFEGLVRWFAESGVTVSPVK